MPRYELTRDELPDCWALHPPVVAELSWLRTAYVQAYLTRSPPQLGADWHTRWRPAVLTRIRELIKPDECAPGKHAPRRGTPVEPAAPNGALPRTQLAEPAVLVAVLRPRLPPRPGAAPGPRRRGRARLVPGPGERLTSPAVQVRSPRRQLMSSDQTRWRGEGWQVSIDGERTGSGAVRVEQAQASPAREARALAAAVTAAATRLDGGPSPSGNVAAPSSPTSRACPTACWWRC